MALACAPRTGRHESVHAARAFDLPENRLDGLAASSVAEARPRMSGLVEAATFHVMRKASCVLAAGGLVRGYSTRTR
ncbi:MAG: hypothetical protein J7M29_07620 [Verrucomicrobia bacterium]|nr:hypothetical protein [Verrucomicrobiota bacterium]